MLTPRRQNRISSSLSLSTPIPSTPIPSTHSNSTPPSSSPVLSSSPVTFQSSNSISGSLNHSDTFHSTVQTLGESSSIKTSGASNQLRTCFKISTLPFDLQRKWKALVNQLIIHTFNGNGLTGAQQDLAIMNLWKEHIGNFNGSTEPSKAEIRAVLQPLIVITDLLGLTTNMECLFGDEKIHCEREWTRQLWLR